jgi:hypothetical protein
MEPELFRNICAPIQTSDNEGILTLSILIFMPIPSRSWLETYRSYLITIKRSFIELSFLLVKTICAFINGREAIG